MSSCSYQVIVHEIITMLQCYHSFSHVIIYTIRGRYDLESRRIQNKFLRYIQPNNGTQFYDIPGSGCSFTTYPGRDAVLRHTRAGMQFYDIPGSGCSFTTHPGRDAVLRYNNNNIYLKSNIQCT